MGAFLLVPFRTHLLSGALWWLCFPRPLGGFLFGFCLGPFVCASVVCLSLLGCLPFVLLVSSLRPLCASPFALGLSVVRLLVVCGCLPPPPRLLPCGVLAQFFGFTGPSLWVSGCFLRRPGCLAFMLGVLWYFASSLHFAPWQQRPLALCGVFDSPSTPWGICGCGALCSLTEVFIFMMIQDPP